MTEHQESALSSSKRTKVLLLDVMDTLVYDPFREAFPNVLGLDLKTVMRDKRDEAWPAFERNEIDEATYFRTMFKDGRIVDGAKITAALVENYRFLDGIEALLNRLVAADVEMHLLSNYPVWYQMLDDKLGLSKYAPWTFVSCRTGVRKPDSEAYVGAARTLGRACDDLVFVDDRAVNVDAARAAGLHAVTFENARQLERELEACGILRR